MDWLLSRRHMTLAMIGTLSDDPPIGQQYWKLIIRPAENQAFLPHAMGDYRREQSIASIRRV
ncbi:hypothetical protein [Sphingomonas nostoxanthinifaciens]|uniref:hypothetical protein n=1 Tax=Sphingomonas nostoxanthinifaciens TaxID=2872652 RepID=UPI001CC1D3FE|nr:hypothetical protein [Sphingomonas nostoxanthinifaciens]UAK25479.1 hypothetical protein K8P63_04710 [Sphingomonas nostoxanthinifaciens]